MKRTCQCGRFFFFVFIPYRDMIATIDIIDIGGVKHSKENDFKYNDAKVVSELHPLGTVYKKGKFGYVANGYDWWKFEINKLETIIKNS